MKKLLVLIFFVILSLSLMSCNYAKNLPSNHTVAAKFGYSQDVIGTWEGSWEYNGNSFYQIIVISDDGYHNSILYKNGIIYEELYDIWYMPTPNTLCCAIDGELDWVHEYRFEDGNIYSGENYDTIFTKKP